MAKTSKSTKKFQSKHLKHTLEHRKEVQKHNKKFASRKKGKTQDEEPKKPKEVFEDMPVDEFFESGFEVPKEKKNKNKPVEESEDESSSDEEDAEGMKETMKGLAENDPEFYKYLKNNDDQLLDFEGINPLDAMEDSDEEDAEADEGELEDEDEKPKKATDSKTTITLELVRKWKADLEKPTAKQIKTIAIAFKAAVNITNTKTDEYKYSITDPKAFSELMVLALKQLPQAIQKLIKYKVSPSGVRSLPQKNQWLSQISSILKSQAGCYITLLKDITNTETASLILASLQEVFPYYISYRRLLKELLNAVTQVWSTSRSLDTQIATFAFLNNVAKEFPKSVLETILKSTYSSFVKNCLQTNAHTMAGINFCKNSASELFGINPVLSYQIGFEYVRQLAIHLRGSINATTKKTANSSPKDAHKLIYNWQYCHSLDFWSRVLSIHCAATEQGAKKAENSLHQLIYPLVQVTLGTIRLIPTAQFFPLRFYLIKSLLRMSKTTGVYIPVFPLLSEILTSTIFTKPIASKKSNLQEFDFEHNIKVSAGYLNTRTYQQGLEEHFVELTAEFFNIYAKSIAFPELATPSILILRRFTKKSKNIKFNKQLQQLVEKLNANSTFILQKRSNVEYGPSNKSEVELFLKDLDSTKTPLGQYVSVQRQVKEEKLRLLREAMADEEAARKEQKEQEDDEDVEMEVEEDEDEEEEDEE
ncbi:nucleolar complex associated [Suhomyces tanzawaensis NRRL Y-17324]|uniref:Nucleolar complex associated n=1 Tax=Suhomyces tanzawaensis NRRL Y-17324 TaxID=984487 RepID=A0A1E4SKP7_9ASCO|nr:nucleolar complex associated [Suhomyces tanzawaensis NRRL Y-17324]ODV80081.1 nucleolar complex associated [Suhomyces tanzawaensis NRRL Y-17324]